MADEEPKAAAEDLSAEEAARGKAKARSRRRSDQPVNNDVADQARATFEAEQAAKEEK